MNLAPALAPPPDSLLNENGIPNRGRYGGAIPEVRWPKIWSPLRLLDMLRQKRWFFLTASSGDLLISVAIVDLTYAGNAFVHVADLRQGRLVAESSGLALPGLNLRVNNRPEEGAFASFRAPGLEIRFERPEGVNAYSLFVKTPELHVDASFDCVGAPDPLCVISQSAEGRPIYTEKRNLLALSGSIELRGARDILKGYAGLDYTNGYPPRDTHWYWSFGLGTLANGDAVGFNLCAGNNLNGQNENAVWSGQNLYFLEEVRFEFAKSAPEEKWRIGSADGNVDLEFEPKAIHRETRNLGLVQSRFVQLAGFYNGTIRIPGGKTLRIDRVPGLAEDQKVRW